MTTDTVRLLADARAGSRDAFDALYARHRAPFATPEPLSAPLRFFGRV